MWMVGINLVVLFSSLSIFQLSLQRTLSISAVNSFVLNFLLTPSLFLSIGIWYDIQWAMQICWFLSIFFATLAFASLSLTRFRIPIFIGAMLLSWLSLSSNIIGAAFLIIALGSWTGTLKKTEAILVLGLSSALTLAGSRLAEIIPPIDPLAAGWPIDFHNILNHALEILLLGSTTLTTWLVTPIGILLPTNEKYFLNLEIGYLNIESLIY